MHWAVQRPSLANKEIDAQDGYWSAVPVAVLLRTRYERYERSDVRNAFITGPCASGV